MKSQTKKYEGIRVFPKMVVPPNHPTLIGISIFNHPFWGTPIFGNTHKVFQLSTLSNVLFHMLFLHVPTNYQGQIGEVFFVGLYCP